MDTLEITGLCFKTKIGVYEWEKHIDQTIIVDLKTTLDSTTITDNLSNTINYDKIVGHLHQFFAEHSFQLIETLTNAIANSLINVFQLEHLWIKVHKPNAISNAKDVSFCIER